VLLPRTNIWLIIQSTTINMSENPKSRDTVLIASPSLKALLSTLHTLNNSQAYSVSRFWYHIKYTIFCLWNWQSRDAWNAYNDLYVKKLQILREKTRVRIQIIKLSITQELHGSAFITQQGNLGDDVSSTFRYTYDTKLPIYKL
jgi:hypothetical protein